MSRKGVIWRPHPLLPLTCLKPSEAALQSSGCADGEPAPTGSLRTATLVLAALCPAPGDGSVLSLT